MGRIKGVRQRTKMPWRYSGSLSNILETERLERERNRKRPLEKEVYEEEEEAAEKETLVPQTFPQAEHISVQRQTKHDLLCGLKCLQNMYGPHITSREEMDTVAQQLETKSGYKMYNEQLGFYDIQVLETTLQEKGKWAKRIDIHKIPPEYFIGCVEMNPTFSGYIVNIGTEEFKHYITIRFTGKYKKIDSLPGVAHSYIPREQLFTKRSNGHVYCSIDCQHPVGAVLAVGNSPFVEYSLLHTNWSDGVVPPTDMIQAIQNTVNTQTRCSQHSRGPVARFFKKWKSTRIEPSTEVYEFLNAKMEEQLLLEKDIHVYLEQQQTIIKCKTLGQLLRELENMEWINCNGYTLEQRGEQVYNSETPGCHTIDWSIPISIRPSQHPQIGGFYTFKTNVHGICTSKNSDTYSVRESDGTVHVLYKKTVENIIH